METLRTFYENILNLLLPKDILVVELEKMPPAVLFATLQQADVPNDASYSALFKYRDPLMKKAVWEIKYQRNTKITRVFGEFLYSFILDTLAEELVFTKKNPLLLIAIPRAGSRIQTYGYDQGKEILKTIQLLDTGNIFSYSDQALKKIHETPQQSKIKTRKERLHNLSGSFAADRTHVAGKYIVLIDDVATTGATLETAAKASREAGAVKVICFALAH